METSLSRQLIMCSLRSSSSPASAICQMSSTVSSMSLPQHFWDPCIFCCQTNSLGIHCLIICAIQLLTPNNLDFKMYLFAGHSKR